MCVNVQCTMYISQNTLKKYMYMYIVYIYIAHVLNIEHLMCNQDFQDLSANEHMPHGMPTTNTHYNVQVYTQISIIIYMIVHCMYIHVHCMLS